MSITDWRQALLTPPVYRVGNSSLRIQTNVVYILFIVGVCLLSIWYYLTPSPTKNHRTFNAVQTYTDVFDPRFCEKKCFSSLVLYNTTYPLTAPVKVGKECMFKIAVVSDLDTESKSKTEKHTWTSYYKTGLLTWAPLSNSVRIEWDATDPIILKSSFGAGGRGMELSELIVFNGKLYTLDDRTGVIYEIENGKVIPWVVLTNGNGRTTKGFKAEWATVKDQILYVGGLGKEWTTPSGELVSHDPQWVKTVNARGEVNHHNWRDQYLKLRQAIGIEFPGYMIHESAVWSDIHKKWFFLPRRASKEQYHEDTDNYKGINIMLTTDENFEKVEVLRVGELLPTHGFSSLKFIPGTNDEIIVALKSEETKEGLATYIMAFTIKGNIILPETKFANLKYEGLEFI